MNKFEKLADLLPDNLDESTTNEILGIISDIVTEQVEAHTAVLESKVYGFFRANVENIKEHALKELHLENKLVRDSAIFEEVKQMLVSELDEEDQIESVKIKNSKISELQEEVDVLVDELTKLVNENKTLRNTNKAISTKSRKLSEALELAKEGIQKLTESVKNPKPFKSSEKAVMSGRLDERKENNKGDLNGIRPPISEASMSLMPKRRN